MSDVSIRCNKNNKNLDLDDLSNALPVISNEHSHIHKGEHFTFSKIFDGIATSATSEILISMSGVSENFHLTGLVSSAYAGKVEFFEDVTIAANGTLVTPRNSNRNYSDGVSATFYHTPTNATGGTSLFEAALAVGGVGAANAGGLAERDDEFILKTDLKYLLRFTSWAASNTATMILDFYI